MKKLFYITRSYADSDKANSCILVRLKYIELLKQIYDVIVITPNYNINEVSDENSVIKVPYFNSSIDYYMEKLGLLEDSLDKWCKRTYRYLINIVKKDDIVFATSGGELACIKLACMLKNKIGCKMVINYRDPVDYSLVNNKKCIEGFHVSREKHIDKYASHADLIISWSKIYCEYLKRKYPQISDKIFNHYIGYITERSNAKTKKNKIEKFNIVYAGVAQYLQSAEIMAEAFGRRNDVRLTYITNSNLPDRISSYSNVTIQRLMPHSEFQNYMINEADIGFVSFNGNSPLSDIALPSKMFEYLGLKIPILAAMSGDEAKEIIDGTFGIVCRWGDVAALNRGLDFLIDLNNYNKIIDNYEKLGKIWYSGNRAEELYEIMDKLNINHSNNK